MVLWRSQPLTPKQARDRAATHALPQLQHLALDFLRSPMRILPSQAKDPLLNLLSQWRPPGSTLLPKSPVSAHELSMPAKQSVGLHDQEGLGQTPFREAQASQQQGQLLQTAIKQASGSAFDSRSTTADGGGESRGPGHAGARWTPASKRAQEAADGDSRAWPKGGRGGQAGQ